jgi:glycosyltransferase involved in cell wall biosynthesis
MKIVIFNWRDKKNPRAGGAEVVTHEIASRWVKSGHQVTLLTASFAGAKKREDIEGVVVIRGGGQLTCRFFAFWYYLKNLRGKIDLTIDEINTLPFFTPLFVREKKIAYINQLAREVWFYESKPPFSWVGYLLEPLYLKFYKKTKTMTISNSTKEELVKMGFEKVEVFSMAIDFDKEQPYLNTKNKNLTLVFVARLVRSKRPDEAIKAFGLIQKHYPEAEMHLVGGGEERYLKQLKKLVADLDLKNVVFDGRVTEAEKFKLMNQAHFILVTSVKEGWGLIVTEANALKTVGAVYNVTGLRDSVIKDETGLVVGADPSQLAREVIQVWEDQKKVQGFSGGRLLVVKKTNLGSKRPRGLEGHY